MMHLNKLIAITVALLLAGTFGSHAFADSKPIIRRSGFSETQIPQVKGRIPIGKNGALVKGASAKNATKSNANENTQSGVATCGPENAQSEFCRKK